MRKIKFIIFLMCAVVLFCSACKQDIKSEICDNISDIRYCIFMGENKDMSVSLMCGMRENPYEFDGKSNKKCEFGIITVNLKNKSDVSQIKYSLTIDKSSFDGCVEENPFDHTYMTDIEKIVSTDSRVFILFENQTDELILSPISVNWAVQYNIAIDIAIDHLGDSVNKYFVKKKFEAECYLKIIFDQNSTDNPYFWYFGIVGKDGTSLSVVIDVQSGEILTEN